MAFSILGLPTFMGPLKEFDFGNKLLLLAVEHFSGWPVSCAIGALMFNSAGFIKFIEEQIC